MQFPTFASAAAMLLALSFSPLPAAAAPFQAGTSSAVTASDVTTVQFRGPRSYGYGRPYARGYGWRPFVGFGALALGAAIIADRAYRPRPGYYYDTYAYDGPYYYPTEYAGDPRDICARHFRSFEWRTGLYTAYSGEKRLCPYLR